MQIKNQGRAAYGSKVWKVQNTSMFSLGIQILNILIVIYRVWEVYNIFLMRFLLPGLSKGKSEKKNL